MAETKRTGIIDKDGGNILANVVESTATPGTYGLVALNPDGSDIGGPASAIVIGNPVVGGNPGRILYIDQAGNLFGDDAAVRDSGVQKQTTIGSGTYAQTNANDGVSAEVYFQADVIGDTGNSISLVFDGIDDADTVLNAWNTANPGNTASIVDGVGTTVPTAGTRPFMGGGEIIYESGTVNNGISTYFQGSGSTLLDTTNGKIGFSTTGNLISVIGEPSLGFVAAGIDSNTGNLGAMVVSDSGIDFFVTDQSTYNARLQGDDVEIILAYNGTYLGVNGLSGPLWGDSSSNRYILPTNVTPSVGDTLAVAGISGNDYALDFVGGGVTIGDAISGGSANEILFADGSTNVAQSTDLFYDDALKIFHVGDFGLAANKTYIALNDQNSKIDLQTTGTFKAGDIGSTGNSTLFALNDSNSVRTATLSGKEMVVGQLNSTHAPTSDPIAMGGTFTGVVTTTYTITVNTGTTFDWTDGTNSGTNVAMDFGSPNVLSQGVTVFFVGGSYTPTEYWTQTYTATVVSRLILDYKNKAYSIGNAGTSGARARIITDGTSNAKVGTYATNYTAEIRTDTSSVGFLYSNGTYSGGFGISGSQASFAISNSASDQSILDFRPTFALFYTQDGGSGYYAGVKTTTTSVKVGDFDLIANSTLLTVDDSNSKITVTKPFGLQGYTVATLPTGFTGATAYVTDALAPAFGATVVGGGAVVMKVRYDGTNWIVG